MHISAKNGAVRTLLHLNSLGGDVDGCVGVVALERGGRLLLPDLRCRGRGKRQRSREASKDDAKKAHEHHLTAP